LWAENHFAYRVHFGSWGYVPDLYNVASYASTQGYSGFFIHNYLGGDKLYRVPKWTSVALIWPDRIEWYLIDGTVRYEGTPTNVACTYTQPYVMWGEELGSTGLTTVQVLNRHYKEPFTIQTSICQGGKVGVHILTGTWTTSE
jgi:hypothetical protein